MSFKLPGQQLPGLVGLAAFVQQLDLRDDGLEVVRVQEGDLLQCSLGVIELAFVQVQAGELALSLGVLRSRSYSSITCCKGPKYRPCSSGDRPSRALAAANRTLCSLSSSNGPSNSVRWALGTRPTML